MRMTSKQELGRLGEDVAILAYATEGFACVARRWRRAEGELDLIMRQNDVLVFAEVKTRRGRNYGLPEESVDARRLARMRRVARRYLHEESPRGIREYRFDVVAIELGPHPGCMSVRLLAGVV